MESTEKFYTIRKNMHVISVLRVCKQHKNNEIRPISLSIFLLHTESIKAAIYKARNTSIQHIIIYSARHGVDI